VKYGIGRNYSKQGREEERFGILLGKPKSKEALGRPEHRQENIIKCIIEQEYRWVSTGYIWLKAETSCGLFQTRL
jgi:hypothetical protein